MIYEKRRQGNELYMSWLKNKYFIIIFGALTCLALDQITKFWVKSAFRPDQSHAVIANFFSITLKQNPGAAFGLFRGQPIAFFLTVSFIALSFILYFIIRSDPSRVRLSAAHSLILGGAMGNISDRIRMGSVVDFLDVHYYDMIWPTFNVADVAIVIGVFFFMWDMSKHSLEYTAPAKSAPGAAISAGGDEGRF